MPFTLPIGAKLPSFTLATTEGTVVSDRSFEAFPILVLFFTCNHCPYVISSDETTRKTALHFQKQGVQFLGINSNSPETYEEDSFYHMVERMHHQKFPWIYAFDPTQEVARHFGALRTPHFFVFDAHRHLVYCGRAIDSPMDPKKATTHDLEVALQALIDKKPIQLPLTNPIGCTIKWKGHDAHWMPPEACDLVR